MASDCPDLPEEILLEANSALENHDAVIGPSTDGGYYLIGFQRTTFSSKAFEGIAWSTASVFKETIEKLKHERRTIQVLPEWSDVDTFEDLKALATRSGNSIFGSSSTMKYLNDHQEILSMNKD